MAQNSVLNSEGYVKLNSKEIYILPTKSGLIFAVATMTMLLGALNYKSNIGLAFTFLFCAVAVMGMIYTWRNLMNLELKITDSPPIFLGQAASFQVRITNPETLARAALIVSGTDVSRVTAVDLEALSTTEIELAPVPERRGRYKVNTVHISSCFPLGLFRAWSQIKVHASVVVYPEPKAQARWQPTIHFVPALKGGDRGVGVEDFIGLRNYRAGDPMKHLDWKSVAKCRDPTTKQFGGDRQEEVWLNWDTLNGDVESKISQLCRLVLDAANLHINYGLKLPEVQVQPASGDKHKHICLGTLALFMH